MGGWAVESLHGSQQPLAGRHGRWEADVLGIQGLVLVVFQLHKWGHQPGRQVEVGHVGHQAGVVMVDVGWALAPHVGWLPIEAVGGRTEVGVLGPSPGRVLVDPRVRHAVAGVVVRGPHLCQRDARLGDTCLGRDQGGHGGRTQPCPEWEPGLRGPRVICPSHKRSRHRPGGSIPPSMPQSDGVLARAGSHTHRDSHVRTPSTGPGERLRHSRLLPPGRGCRLPG